MVYRSIHRTWRYFLRNLINLDNGIMITLFVHLGFNLGPSSLFEAPTCSVLDKRTRFRPTGTCISYTPTFLDKKAVFG